jgi:prepilin-type N-terminal cleavage/methylation domain-containing protein
MTEVRTAEQQSSRAAVTSKIKKRITDSRGFTLIELAIVLVIIGIIIGAVLKGQDLVDSARHKKLTTEIKQWEVATWTYLDRKGRFPGDGDKDGTIGSGTGTNDVKADFDASGLAIAPTTNSISLGSATFYLFLGNAGARKNIIAVCVSDSCGTAIGDDGVLFAEAVDTSIDGTADGTTGRFRGTNNAPAGASSATWVATWTASPTYASWTSTTAAMLYFFDKKP